MAHRNILTIQRLFDLVGSSTIIASATASQTRTSPQNWLNGNSHPSEGEWRKIVFIVDLMETVARHKGKIIARQWFLGDFETLSRRHAPYVLIGSGLFDEAEKNALSFIRRR